MFDLPTKRSRAHMAAAKRQGGFPPFSNPFAPPPFSNPLSPPPVSAVGPVNVPTDTDTGGDLPPYTSTVVVVVPPSSTPQAQPTTTQASPPPPPSSSTTTPSTTSVAPPAPPPTTSTTSTPVVVNTPTTTPTPSSSSTPIADTSIPPTVVTTPAAVTRSKAAATTPGAANGSTITHVNTVTGALAGHTSAASALPSQTITASSSSSKGELAGGIAAAVVACAGILFALVWALRKCRGRRDEFDADGFKRKSVALPDEPSAWQPRPNGDVDGPHPPTMLERAAVAPSVVPGYAPAHAPAFAPGYAPTNAPAFAPGYGPAFAPGYAPAFAPYGGPAPWTPGPGPQDFAHAQAQNAHMSGYSTASFSPGDVVFSSPQSPPATAMAAQPVFFVPGSPARGFGGLDAHGAPAIGESIPSTPTQDAPPALARAPSTARQSRDAPSHYVDLDRSSVTPFQARQYSELHARLEQIAPPPPLPTKAVASPFADPVTPAQDAFVAHEDHEAAEHEVALDDTSDVQHGARDESEVQHVVGPDEDDEELAAPAPTYDRITSMPPTLPELLPRAFSPVSLGTEDEFNFTLHAGGSALAGESFPSTPLPPTTPAEAAFVPAPAPRRPETVYDTEDAYDGI